VDTLNLTHYPNFSSLLIPQRTLRYVPPTLNTAQPLSGEGLTKSRYAETATVLEYYKQYYKLGKLELQSEFLKACER
jgi:hypothetical protein